MLMPLGMAGIVSALTHQPNLSWCMSKILPFIYFKDTQDFQVWVWWPVLSFKYFLLLVPWNPFSSQLSRDKMTCQFVSFSVKQHNNYPYMRHISMQLNVDVIWDILMVMMCNLPLKRKSDTLQQSISLHGSLHAKRKGGLNPFKLR